MFKLLGICAVISICILSVTNKTASNIPRVSFGAITVNVSAPVSTRKPSYPFIYQAPVLKTRPAMFYRGESPNNIGISEPRRNFGASEI